MFSSMCCTPACNGAADPSAGVADVVADVVADGVLAGAVAGALAAGVEAVAGVDGALVESALNAGNVNDCSNNVMANADVMYKR